MLRSPLLPGPGPSVRRLLIAIALAAASAARAEGLFPEPYLPAGTTPAFVTTADLNRDGTLDLVAANLESHDLSVFLGGQSGSFGPETRYPTGYGPCWIATGDLNVDGFLDLASADCFDSTVTIWLGAGDGTFGNPSAMPSGDMPWAVVIADLNGDSRQDLAVSGYFGVWIYPAGPGGSLTYPVEVPFPATALAAADLVGGRAADLVAAGEGTLTVISSSGGSFSAGPAFGIGDLAGAVAVADLNGDGIQDIATANVESSDVSVLLGSGGGFFRAETRYPVGPEPWSLVVGDYNEDGRKDIVAMNSAAFTFHDPGLSFLAGLGNGAFAAEVRSPVLYRSYGIAGADFDKDRHQDLIVTQSGVDALVVMSGTGKGTFGLRASFIPTSLDPANLAAGDVDNDGIDDLVVPIRGDFPASVGGISVFKGSGNGSFTRMNGLVVPSNPHSVAMGDLDGDGDQDLVVATTGDPPSYPSDVRVFLGAGDGTFTHLTTFDQASGGGAILLADFDRDDRLDLAHVRPILPSSSVAIRIGAGDGTFGAETLHAIGHAGLGLVTGDFNGDDRIDLAAVNRYGRSSPGDLSVLLGRGDGTFEPERVIPTDQFEPHVIAADLDEDGWTDLALGSSSIRILRSNGDGSFSESPSGGSLQSVYGLAAADFDGQGHKDLAAIGSTLLYPGMFVLPGDGSGDFGEGAPTVSDFPRGLMVVGDFNRDRRRDLAVPMRGGVQIFLNRGPARNEPPVAAAAAEAATECTSAGGARVMLDGSASSDPDSSDLGRDDIAAFDWFERYGTSARRLIGSGEKLEALLPLGAHHITLRVTDRMGAVSTATVDAEVVDTIPPVMTASLTPSVLWPADHRLVVVKAAVTATDQCGKATWVLGSIAGNEPDDAPGLEDGATTRDIRKAVTGTRDAAFRLRAERSDTGAGRIYTATFTATDRAGMTMSLSVDVAVPIAAPAASRPAEGGGPRSAPAGAGVPPPRGSGPDPAPGGTFDTPRGGP